jgi:hypothetical protein
VILGPIFAAGALVTAVAIVPALALGGRARMLTPGAAADGGPRLDGVGEDDDGDRGEPTFAI